MSNNIHTRPIPLELPTLIQTEEIIITRVYIFVELQ
jgi:hypothetical protein